MEVRKGYACPQGYKQTEIGVIPEDWGMALINDIADVVRGGSPRPAGDPRYFNGNFIPWLTVASLTNISASQAYVSETVGFLTEEGSKHSRILEKGILIISNSGATLGVAKILSIRCCANDGIAALLDIDKNANELFLCHYLNTQTKRFREVIATGNGQPNLNTALIGTTKIPIPPLPEQHAIAAALSDMDSLLIALDALIAKKRLIKQGAMQELLTGKKRLPGFNGKWEVKTLDELFHFSGGYSASRDQLSSNGYCYLHYGDIHMSKKTFVDLKTEFHDIPKLNINLKRVSEVSLLNDGDIVFVDASEDDEGASRHVVIVNPDNIPFISGLHTIVAKGKTNELAHLYRRYCFQTRAVKDQFRFYAVGTKVTGISKTNIAKITLPVPSIPEQQAIAEILSDMDAEIAALEARREKTSLLKQGMTQELLTGKIRLV